MAIRADQLDDERVGFGDVRRATLSIMPTCRPPYAGAARRRLAGRADGTAAVLATGTIPSGTVPATPRVRQLTPEPAKGLEFDLVVVVDPAKFGSGVGGAVDRYVAMTRATQQLVIRHGP